MIPPIIVEEMITHIDSLTTRDQTDSFINILYLLPDFPQKHRVFEALKSREVSIGSIIK